MNCRGRVDARTRKREYFWKIRDRFMRLPHVLGGRDRWPIVRRFRAVVVPIKHPC